MSEQIEDKEAYLVYSREHNAWWGPNHCGYFVNVCDAGRYTETEASMIVDRANRGRGAHGDEGPPEFAVLASALLAARK